MEWVRNNAAMDTPKSSPQNIDVYLLFTHENDEDSEFATKILETMHEKYNLKVILNCCSERINLFFFSK